MRIIVGDLWHQPGIKIVPTNLSVNQWTGKAVMGRGVAAQAVDRCPHLPSVYGRALLEGETGLVKVFEFLLLPVKEKWSDKASLSLIAKHVQALADRRWDMQCYLPLLGAGFGELESMPVLTLLARKLSDDFTLVLRGPQVVERYADSFRQGSRRDATKDMQYDA